MKRSPKNDTIVESAARNVRALCKLSKGTFSLEKALVLLAVIVIISLEVIPKLLPILSNLPQREDRSPRHLVSIDSRATQVDSGSIIGSRVTQIAGNQINASGTVNVTIAGEILPESTKAGPAAAPRAELLNFQLQEIEKLQEFFTNKDENALRRQFAFPDLLRYNALLWKRYLKRASLSPELSAEIDAFFLGGEGVGNLAAANTYTNGNRVPILIPKRGRIPFINISKQFCENRDTIRRFEGSTILPPNVREELKRFDQALADRVNLIWQVFNDHLVMSPDYFIYGDDQTKLEFFAVVENSYWKQFGSLKERADALDTAIRAHLRTE